MVANQTPVSRNHFVQFRRVLFALLAIAVMLAAIAGCDTPQTTFEPRSEETQGIHSIYIFVIVAASIVGFLVLAAMVYILIKYRAKDGRKARQIHGNIPLEITWTIIPILILVSVAIPTVIWVVGTQADPDPDVLEVTAVGHQWWFEFRYPGLGPDGADLVTANELVIPVGRQVSVSLESKDVIHSFWVPQLIGKTDMVPGRMNPLDKFTPTEIGLFYGQCAEFCGSAHALMRFRVRVDSLGDFDRWVASMNSAPGTPAVGSAEAAGQTVFATNCGFCHAIQGVSTGEVGPNLTLFGERTTVGAGILDSSTENVRAWVSNLRDLKPVPEGIGMPTFAGALSEDQITQVVAYLKGLTQ